MGFGSYAGGITRGIQNGVNISLALRADKRAEANQKIGIQRQEKADSRADTTWEQSQSAIAEKKRIKDVNRNFQKAAYMLGTAGGADKVTAEQLTDAAKSAGVFDDFRKDNQSNYHFAKFPDGGYTIQFNQNDDAGNLMLDENGQAKWFTLTEGRGTTDNGVRFNGDQATKMIMGKFIAQDGDYKLAEPFINKGMTEREKLALKSKYTIAEQNNASKNKLNEKKLGAGAKPSIVTLKNGQKVKESDIVAAYKADIGDGLTKGEQSYADFRNGLVADGFKLNKKEPESMPLQEAQALADERYNKEASILQSDDAQFGMSEQQVKDKWTKDYMTQGQGDAPISSSEDTQGRTEVQQPAQPVISNKAKSLIDSIMKPKAPVNAGLGIKKKHTNQQVDTIESVTKKMKAILATQKKNSPLNVEHSKAYLDLKAKLIKLKQADDERNNARVNQESRFERNPSSNYRGTM